MSGSAIQPGCGAVELPVAPDAFVRHKRYNGRAFAGCSKERTMPNDALIVVKDMTMHLLTLGVGVFAANSVLKENYLV